MSTQIPKKRAILFILIPLNVHEIQTQKFSYRLCLPCLLPWGTYLLPPTFSENSCRYAPRNFPKNLRSKGIPHTPLTKTREFSFFHFPPQRGGIGICGKMDFSQIPFFSALLLPAKIHRSFRGIKRKKKNI